MTAIRIAIVGLGKIAREQHIPAIAGTEGVELVAIADPNASLDGIAHFATLDALLAAKPDIDAVALDVLRLQEFDERARRRHALGLFH